MNRYRLRLQMCHAYLTNETLSNDTKVNDLGDHDRDLYTKNSQFWTLLPLGAFVFHKHTRLIISCVFCTGVGGEGGCCSDSFTADYARQILQGPNAEPSTANHARRHIQGQETHSSDVRQTGERCSTSGGTSSKLSRYLWF